MREQIKTVLLRSKFLKIIVTKLAKQLLGIVSKQLE